MKKWRKGSNRILLKNREVITPENIPSLQIQVYGCAYQCIFCDHSKTKEFSRPMKTFIRLKNSLKSYTWLWNHFQRPNYKITSHDLKSLNQWNLNTFNCAVLTIFSMNSLSNISNKSLLNRRCDTRAFSWILAWWANFQFIPITTHNVSESSEFVSAQNFSPIHLFTGCKEVIWN